jgi:hypothetical protein
MFNHSYPLVPNTGRPGDPPTFVTVVCHCFQALPPALRLVRECDLPRPPADPSPDGVSQQPVAVTQLAYGGNTLFVENTEWVPSR